MSRRGLVAGLVVLVALVLQASVLPHLAVRGVAPDILLVVVATAGLACGSQFGLLTGFAGGLLLDLAPPADHVAGRWALALLVVGYVAGRVRGDEAGAAGADRAVPSVVQTLATVGACSFLGSSLFAMTGLVLHDHALGFGALLHVVLVGVVMDLVATPFVAPWFARLLVRVEPEQLHARWAAR